MEPFLVWSRLWQDPRMLCRDWSVVFPQLLQAQLHVAHPLVGAGARSEPPSPGRSPLPLLPLCRVQCFRGRGMSQLTPVLRKCGWTGLCFGSEQIS